MTSKTSPDEIDLMGVLASGYRVFKENLAIFIALPLLGATIALVMAFLSKDKFASSMMITTDLLTENEAQFIFYELNRADSIPGLSKEQRKDLLRLEFEIERNSAGVTDKNVYLKISAEVLNPKLYPELETLIVKYLNETDPIIRNRKELETYYREMIKKIDTEIAGMEEVKKQTNSQALANYIAPSDLYSKTVDLYKMRTENEIRLQDIQSIHLVKGFGSLIKDAKIAKPLAAIIGFVCGGLTVVVILFIKFFKAYNERASLKEA